MKKTIGLIMINLFFMTSVYAGIGVEPIQVEISVDRGIESSGICKVLNTGEKKMQVTVRTEDWLKLGIDPDTWLTIEPKQFIVEPGSVSEVKYNVSAPLIASGEFMAMIFFSGVEENNSVGTEFGIPIYATIKGTEVINGEIIEINANYNEKDGLNGYINIKNNGNVHIRPYTSINVINNEGNSIAYFGAQYGLPVQVSKERKYAFTKKDIKLIPGTYKIIAESEYGSLYKTEGKAKKEIEFIVNKNEVDELSENETDQRINWEADQDITIETPIIETQNI